METNVVSFVGALERQVSALLAEVAAAKAEGIKLMGVIDGMSDDDFLGAWDRMEAEYGTLFGPRGVYPEIPRRWMSVIVRLASRLRAELSPAEYAAVEVTSVKEKFGMLSIGYWVDGDALPDYLGLYSRVTRLVEAAEDEAQRMEFIFKSH